MGGVTPGGGGGRTTPEEMVALADVGSGMPDFRKQHGDPLLQLPKAGAAVSKTNAFGGEPEREREREKIGGERTGATWCYSSP